MTPFQIISVIFSCITLLGVIAGVYIRLKIDITKIEMSVKGIEKELQQKEIAILNAEKFNREDHKEIMKKINELIQMKC